MLKVTHHGSAGSSCYAFLRAAMPTYAVISVGSGNSYGHPTDEALSRLRDCGATVFRTDLQGDIVATSDGETVSQNKNIDSNLKTCNTKSRVLLTSLLCESYAPIFLLQCGHGIFKQALATRI